MARDWAAMAARKHRDAAIFLEAAAAAHRRDWDGVERTVRSLPDPHRCGSMLAWYRLTPPASADDWVALEAVLCTAAEGSLIALKDLRVRASH